MGVEYTDVGHRMWACVDDPSNVKRGVWTELDGDWTFENITGVEFAALRTSAKVSPAAFAVVASNALDMWSGLDTDEKACLYNSFKALP